MKNQGSPLLSVQVALDAVDTALEQLRFISIDVITRAIVEKDLRQTEKRLISVRDRLKADMFYGRLESEK